MSAHLATTWPLLLLARATAVLLAAVVVVFLLRRRSASARHAVLGLTLAGLLILPVLSLVLPKWEVAVLPSQGPAAPARALRPLALDPPLRTEIGGSRTAEGDSRSAARSHRPAAAVPSAAGRTALPSSGPLAPSFVEPEGPAAINLSPRLSGGVVSGWLALVWIVGTAIGILRMVQSSVLAGRTRRQAAELVEPTWQQEIDDTARTLGLRGRVRLLMSDAVRVPVVHGFRSPAIVLPTSAVQWPADRRRAFLLHELAHVRRQDWPVQMLGHVARALYWPHPLAWWVVRRLRAEAERACDDSVLRSGTPASDYAEHLLQAARDLGRAPQHAAVVAAVERSHFEDRLLALLDPQVCRRPVDGRRLGLGAAMGLAVVVGVAGLQPIASAVADTPERPTKEDRVARPARVRSAPPIDRVAVSVPASAGPGRAAGQATPPASPAVVATPTPEALEEIDDPPESEDMEEADEDVALPAAPLPPPVAAPVASPVPVAAPRPVIRISTDLVQIDAVITNKQGQDVVGLGPEDIELFQDGRKQNVTHVQYVARRPPSGAKDRVTPNKAAEASEPRTIVFVIDDLGLSLESTVRTRRLMQAFVRSGLQPRDRAAIVATSAIQRGTTMMLTGDPAILSSAADGIRHLAWSRASLDTMPTNLETTSRHSQLIAQSLAALKNAVDALRNAPGRKAVVLVSEGFTTRVGHDVDAILQRFTATALDTLYGDSDLFAALRHLTDMANRASVVIYALEPGGLRVDSLEADVQAGPRDSRDSDGLSTGSASGASEAWRRRAAIRTAREDSLIEIAEQTGGIAVISNNDLANGLDRIIADHSAYYLIGYVPDAATFRSTSGPPPFHNVRVEVKRPGLRVRSRKGFYGVTDEVVAQTAPPTP
jgi:VWFA-related protein